MRFSTLLVLGLVGSGAAIQGGQPIWRRDGPSDDSAPTDTDKKTAVEPKKFIVEFAAGTDAQAAANAIGAPAGNKVLKVFDSDVFKGAAIEAPDENVDSLQAQDPVLKAWTTKRIQLAPPIAQKSFSETATGQNYSTHAMTGVDKLHEAGILGKGVVVAVVDTGIDYNHPALGGGFGPGFKVAGGYDLVGDGFWPNIGEVKQPDADPMDQEGHGTHVSGIIAATLLMYKVFTQSVGTDEATLIDAFIMAYNAGADIITSSIGGSSGWSDNAWAVVASRLVDQGVVVTISAGNDGSIGPFAASSGSSGEHVLAIASVEADIVMSPSFKVTFNLDGQSNETYIAYRSTVDWSNATTIKGWPIVPLTLSTTVLSDACNQLPAGTPSLSNTVVLVRRGGCNFSVKQANVAAFGATHLLVYNNESPLVIPGSTLATPLLAMLTADAGAGIIGTVRAGGNVTADFTVDPIERLIGVENGLDGGLASYFTSIGPTNDLFIKPDVAAPGGQIFSTYLNGGWAVLSGTSMACPYVAGVAALYIGKHGGRKTNGNEFAKDLAMRIISSGESVKWDDGQQRNNPYDFYASVAQLGTGLINAEKILNYNTGLSFSKFALNDTHHFSRYHKVDITNQGTQTVTYTFESLASGGMETFLTDLNVFGAPRMGLLEDVIFNPLTMVPSISFPGGSFTVAPGQTKTAQFNFNYPTGLHATKLPVYSGKVLIKGSNNETVGVPYMGLAADLHKDLGKMFQYTNNYPTITSTDARIPIDTKSNFTFDLATDKQDFPDLYTRLNFATTELRWDIFDSSWVERDWKYPPVVGKAGYIGSATSWSLASKFPAFDPSIRDANDVFALPLIDLPRDFDGYSGTSLWWLGKLANGTQIAPGKYKMRFAALVPFGTPENANNWDVFPTPGFEVLKK
ncbi:putative minor extracellular protease vpr [Amylocarpus encephaloides]|uniref:Minor extracellular protease vpr n=1 Tax=Amylocarpus encephaloides TaxID=45428 RepID=A0A9P8C3T6_9HELO|nr:putative minor extracellular protease vpr [Amylocarpus encephaloides]